MPAWNGPRPGEGRVEVERPGRADDALVLEDRSRSRPSRCPRDLDDDLVAGLPGGSSWHQRNQPTTTATSTTGTSTIASTVRERRRCRRRSVRPADTSGGALRVGRGASRRSRGLGTGSALRGGAGLAARGGRRRGSPTRAARGCRRRRSRGRVEVRLEHHRRGRDLVDPTCDARRAFMPASTRLRSAMTVVKTLVVRHHHCRVLRRRSQRLDLCERDRSLCRARLPRERHAAGRPRSARLVLARRGQDRPVVGDRVTGALDQPAAATRAMPEGSESARPMRREPRSTPRIRPCGVTQPATASSACLRTSASASSTAADVLPAALDELRRSCPCRRRAPSPPAPRSRPPRRPARRGRADRHRDRRPSCRRRRRRRARRRRSRARRGWPARGGAGRRGRAVAPHRDHAVDGAGRRAARLGDACFARALVELVAELLHLREQLARSARAPPPARRAASSAIRRSWRSSSWMRASAPSPVTASIRRRFAPIDPRSRS